MAKPHLCSLHVVALILLWRVPSIAGRGLSKDEEARLRGILNYYETLSPAEIKSTAPGHSRSKREIGDQLHASERNGLAQVQFSALGRHFNLYLIHDRSMYAEGFEAMSMGSSGTTQRIAIPDTNLYTGHVSGETATQAIVYWENDAMVAKIETKKETYYIEPVSRWLPGSNGSLMLAYRLSDVNPAASVANGKRSSFCGSTQKRQAKVVAGNSRSNRDQRTRREIPLMNTCPLFVIADYLFFRDIANGSEAAAVFYMVNMVNKVDKIFRRTVWDNGWTNLGFSIRKTLVHTSWSTDNRYHYNAERRWTADELFDALGNHTAHQLPFDKFCLVHLFTGYRGLNGVLGFATIGSPNLDAGLCAQFLTPPEEAEDLYKNIGFTTLFSMNRRRLLESEAETLLAHELGHNWGSNHDMNTTLCSPDPDDAYIMHPFSNPHPKANGKLFSPCSKEEITQVLETKISICFEVVQDPTRGNYRVDEGEECDAGVTGDICCGSDFKLRTIETCSDVNDECCNNCSTAEANNTVCQSALTMNCRAEAVCNGVDKACPVAFRDEGSKCYADNSGRCISRKQDNSSESVYCAPLCETIGLRSCMCSQASSMCQLCCQRPGQQCAVLRRSDYEGLIEECPADSSRHCRRNGSFSFEPYEWTAEVIHFAKDSPCIIGFCDAEGVCKKQPQDQLFSLFNFISAMTSSQIVTFMKDNVVGTIVTFSFILWIPFALCINHMDNRAAREARSRLPSYRSDSIWFEGSPYLLRKGDSSAPLFSRTPSH